MIDTHCRIGKIKLKRGGEMRLLPDAKSEHALKQGNELKRLAQIIIDYMGADLAGYALVAWNRNMGSLATYSTDDGPC